MSSGRGGERDQADDGEGPPSAAEQPTYHDSVTPAMTRTAWPVVDAMNLENLMVRAPSLFVLH